MLKEYYLTISLEMKEFARFYLQQDWEEYTLGDYFSHLNYEDAVICFWEAFRQDVDLDLIADDMPEAINCIAWYETFSSSYFKKLHDMIVRDEYGMEPNYIEEDGPYED